VAKGFKTGGRVAGTPNKMSASIRDAIVEAFERVGGADYLERVAGDNPQVFCALLGKALPMQITGGDGGPVQIVVATGVPHAG